jgi:hypothetical protein
MQVTRAGGASPGDSDVHDSAPALGVGPGWGKHLGIAGKPGGSVPVATSKTERGRHLVRPGQDHGLTVFLGVMDRPRWREGATSNPR